MSGSRVGQRRAGPEWGQPPCNGSSLGRRGGWKQEVLAECSLPRVRSEGRACAQRGGLRSWVSGRQQSRCPREADHRAHALLRKSDVVFQTPLQTRRQIFGSTLRTPCLPGGRLRRRYSHVKGRTRLEKISPNTFSRASV